jgi:ArsR family transcriptional regulator
MLVNMFMKSKFGLFRALGDRTRYNIVSALLGGERCACEIPKLVKRAQPTVSLQLKYLLKAGILSSRRDGKKVLYRIADGRTEKFLRSAGMG